MSNSEFIGLLVGTFVFTWAIVDLIYGQTHARVDVFVLVSPIATWLMDEHNSRVQP